MCLDSVHSEELKKSFLDGKNETFYVYKNLEKLLIGNRMIWATLILDVEVKPGWNRFDIPKKCVDGDLVCGENQTVLYSDMSCEEYPLGGHFYADPHNTIAPCVRCKVRKKDVLAVGAEGRKTVVVVKRAWFPKKVKSSKI